MQKRKEQLEEDLKVIEQLEKNTGQKFETSKAIKKELDNLQQMINEEEERKNYKYYLKGFDEEFQTHLQDRMKETPLLLNLFREFVKEIYSPTKIERLAVHIKAEIKEELDNTLTIEQKYYMEQLQFLEDRILDDMVEQGFVYGYAMGIQLKNEAIKQYPYKGDKK